MTKCTFYSLVNITFEHFFGECECVNKFPNEAITWLSQQNLHIALSEKSFLFGLYKDQENSANKLILMEIKY